MNYQEYLKVGCLASSLLAGVTLDAQAQGNPAKLIALWDFNDASAPTLSKDRLRGITGTNLNGAVFTADAAGRSGQAGDRAIDFLSSGGNRYVRVPTGSFINAAAADDDITVSFWQKLHSTPAASSFWMVSPSSPNTQRGYQAHVPWSDGTVYFDSTGCCTAEGRISGPIADFPGYVAGEFWTNWHHFAFVKNGAVKEVWIDGQLFVSGDQAIPLPLDFIELTIGATVGGVNPMRGQIDDFAVWGNALDEAQITQLAGGAAPTALVIDTDNDGMPDWWEDQYTLNKNSNDAAADADSDGLPNLQEYVKLTDPKTLDTDGDGLRDGIETDTGVWVSATDTGTSPSKTDTDGDGLSDSVETNSGTFVNAGNPGTNPVKKDTDGDGHGDGTEIRFNGHPLDATKTPASATETKLVAYWDFNDSTDPAKTIDKAFNIEGVLTNEAVFTAGRTGNANDSAIAFGTAGSSVLVSDGGFANIAGVNNEMTVSFWQALTDVAATSSAWIESTVAGRGFNVHVPWSDSVIYFDTAGTDGNTRVSRNINLLPGYDEATWDWTQWHHFAFVKNGNTKEIWVDGKLLVRGQNSTPLPQDYTRLWIGSQPNGGAPVHGTIDDFAVFASALDANRILELSQGRLPNQIETLVDTDNDGMPDVWEIANGTNKDVNDASLDPDADGLTNLQEYQRGTQVNVADTDGDGLKDGVESDSGTFVSATDTGTDPLIADTDADGVSDSVENGSGTFVNAGNPGTNPTKADTDGDGVPDGAEIMLETSPVNGGSSPIVAGQPNLLAYWNFNNASNPEVAVDVIHDITGTVTNAAVYGAPSSGRTGAASDLAMDFGTDSAGQAIWVTNALFLNAAASVDKLSVSLWQQLYGVANSSAFWMVSPGSANRGFQAHTPWGDSTIYFDTAGCCGADTRVNANINTLAGYDEATWDWTQWHHFAFVKDGSLKQIWIDGKLLTSGNAAIPLRSDFTTMMIGAEPPNAANSIQGIIDDLAVFASRLTPEQIAELVAGKLPTEITGGAAPAPTISLASSAGKITITFTGVLQSSETLLPGSFTPVQGANSPHDVTTTAAGSHRFYRAVSP